MYLIGSQEKDTLGWAVVRIDHPADGADEDPDRRRLVGVEHVGSGSRADAHHRERGCDWRRGLVAGSTAAVLIR